MPSPLIADACLIITFGSVGRLSLVTGISDRDALVGSRARSEVKRPPARDTMNEAISSDALRVVSVDLEVPAEADALARFDRRTAFRGRGEAELLALAAARGYVVGSDDGAVRRTAASEFGAARIATSLDILLWAVRQERLEPGDAERLLDMLDVGAGIRRTLARVGRSFQDLL